MSSKVMGCLALSWAAISNPNARISAQTKPIRRKICFMLSPLKRYQCASLEGLAESRMMSCFRRESNSAASGPEPIGKSEDAREGDHEEFAAVHARDKN